MNSKTNYSQSVAHAFLPARSGAEWSVPYLLYRLFSHSQEWLCYTVLVAAVLLGAGTALAQSNPAAPPDAKAAPATVAAGLSRPASAAAPAAGGSAQAQAAPAAASVTPAAKRRGGGEQEGIKVHGHWTLVVKNPDGTVADKRDFENSLDIGGMAVLEEMLGGTVSPGAWAVSLGNRSGGTGPCTGAAFTPFPNNAPDQPSSGNCIMVLPGGVYASGNSGALAVGCGAQAGCTPNLTLTPQRINVLPVCVPISGCTFGVTSSGLQLQGTATATEGGTIDTVASLLMVCPGPTLAGGGLGASTVSPGSCTLTSGNQTASAGSLNILSVTDPGGSLFGIVVSSTQLTGATATSTPPAPVTVIQNQTIQVTVLFTFN